MFDIICITVNAIQAVSMSENGAMIFKATSTEKKILNVVLTASISNCRPSPLLCKT